MVLADRKGCGDGDDDGGRCSEWAKLGSVHSGSDDAAVRRQSRLNYRLQLP